MSVGTARENGSFNVSSICALQHVVDTAKQQEVLHKTMIPEWTREGKDIEFETSNWLLLDGLRHTVPNQYDLLIRSVGIHTNEELVMAAIEQTKASFKEWLDALAEGTLPIKTTESTMERGYDVQLPNENHTNGGILRTVMYNRYASGKSPTLLFVGVKKMHPFHTHSLLRVAFAADSSPQALAQIIAECIAEAIAVLSAMAVAVSGTAGKR
jgi:DNA-directed RNA polymerase subunit L